MSEKFHDKAKEASNQLKGYVLSFSSVATGVFFFTLTGKDVSLFSLLEKSLLLVAMSFFAGTVLLCLAELHIDSKRFFMTAKQKEKPEHEQNWDAVRRLKKWRIKVILSSYITAILGFAFTFCYMISRVA